MKEVIRNHNWEIIGIGFLPVVVIFLSLVVFKNLLTAFVLYHILICIIVPYAYLRNHRSKTNVIELLGLSIRKSGIVIGLGIGIVFFVTIVVFFHFFGGAVFSKQQVDILLSQWGYRKELFFFLCVYFILFNSVVEELFWRGFLFSQYRKTIGNVLASIAVSFFFIQYHFVTIWLLMSLPIAIAFTPLLFGVSLFWCYLCLRYRTIYPAIVSHLLADLAIMFVYYIT